ncbi:MAG: thiamine pyrophosphate-binding protein [Gammaproteobacteria bacterium]|nr:thiamine pyrophosphate-binding protein [Gammaproteobacteria bacterium]
METELSKQMRVRARAIARHGSIAAAMEQGELARQFDTTLSEGVVLGLLKQGVRKYLAIFGHGSTDLGEVLRVYEEEGVVRTWNCRNEIAMAHTATALSWQYGEVSAVITSIGPGALQAMAGSLAAASNGVGVYHIYGDETTHGEGYNMQQVPKPQQGLFGQMTAAMGESYVLHTPQALRDMLRKGTARVHHPTKAGPFYILLPLNTQPQALAVNLEGLPEKLDAPRLAAADDAIFLAAAEKIRSHAKIVIKVGGGGRRHAAAIRRLAEASGAVAVLSPGSTGVLPDAHPQNMHVGGSKGSISGNYAMANGELLIVIGSRAVCQADSSGIGYENAKAVININADLSDVSHYNQTLALWGDIGANIDRLLAVLGEIDMAGRREWLDACAAKKAEWRDFKESRYAVPPLQDEAFDRALLTQPVAIKLVADFASEIGAVKFFDAGDVQANGFQIVEDDHPGQSFTDSGASYMGFAVSAIPAGGIADNPQYSIAFSGDGSFMMNPQVLIDAVEHGARGMVVIFDNRRMAAISGLQWAQYGHDYRTNDGVAVDYVRLANAVDGVLAVDGGGDAEALSSALRTARAHDGLALVWVPVYAGEDDRGGMGAYGSWNVGNWCEDVQKRWHSQNI